MAWSRETKVWPAPTCNWVTCSTRLKVLTSRRPLTSSKHGLKPKKPFSSESPLGSRSNPVQRGSIVRRNCLGRKAPVNKGGARNQFGKILDFWRFVLAESFTSSPKSHESLCERKTPLNSEINR